MSKLDRQYNDLVFAAFSARELARTMRRCSSPCVTDPCAACDQDERDVARDYQQCADAVRAFERRYSVRTGH